MDRISSIIRWKGHKRKRSRAQDAQLAGARASAASLRTESDSTHEKENQGSSELERAQERGNNYQRSLYNEKKRLKRAHTVNTDQARLLEESRAENQKLSTQVGQLTAEVADLDAESSSLRDSLASQKSSRSHLSKKIHTLAAKCRRIPDRLETAATKAASKAKEELTRLFSFNLKEKGAVPDSTRDMINNLVALDGVRPNKVVLGGRQEEASDSRAETCYSPLCEPAERR
ncbi:hypothetical protein R3P38DRAFT_2776206 [Favolaschia claudopus]|uniref:Uncharacterized protein n=1 Tax=Favolaschia claudopus TaxID=2862362 RepID=A0AAW0BSL2_9AGAR